MFSCRPLVTDISWDAQPVVGVQVSTLTGVAGVGEGVRLGVVVGTEVGETGVEGMFDGLTIELIEVKSKDSAAGKLKFEAEIFFRSLGIFTSNGADLADVESSCDLSINTKYIPIHRKTAIREIKIVFCVNIK